MDYYSYYYYYALIVYMLTNSTCLGGTNFKLNLATHDCVYSTFLTACMSTATATIKEVCNGDVLSLLERRIYWTTDRSDKNRPRFTRGSVACSVAKPLETRGASPRLFENASLATSI